MATYDVIVIGAGIVGTALARECARASLRVAIIEQGMVGGGISAAGMGHIVALDDSPAQLTLSAYSRSLWQLEKPQLPSNVEYETRGTVWVAADAAEIDEARSKEAVYKGAGIACSLLDAITLKEIEPNLRAGLAGGLLVPDDGVLYPPTAAQHFLSEAKALGAVLVNGRATRVFQKRVYIANGDDLHAAAIVLATGADVRLLPEALLKLRKGHLVITDRYPGFAHHQLVELGYVKSARGVAGDSVAFNVQPRSTGQLLIGSSRQYGDEDTAVLPIIVGRMLARAASYMPGLRSMSGLRVWTGFRAATSDKLPLIGPATSLTGDSSLWLSTGYEGLGITNALGAARLLVDQLLTRASEIDPIPYLPIRLTKEAVRSA